MISAVDARGREMQIRVTGRRITVNDELRAYAEEKFGRLSKIFDTDSLLAEVVLRSEKNPSIPNRNVAEITMRLRGGVVRAEEAATDMRAAIDLAAEKAEVQMRKYKTRIIDRRNGKGTATVVKTAPGAAELKPQEEEPQQLVRVKDVEMQPIAREDAILQLELLGHDFFVFKDAETNEIGVIYRRKDGDYGLIRPA